MAAERWRRGRFTISTDPRRLDAASVHAALARSYWAKGRPADVVRRSLKSSICFGLYDGRAQIGLARVISDRETFAYLCDVYVDEKSRGAGLGKWLVRCVLESKALARVRSWLLMTQDAHGLYKKYGFDFLDDPKRVMGLKRRPPRPRG